MWSFCVPALERAGQVLILPSHLLTHSCSTFARSARMLAFPNFWPRTDGHKTLTEKSDDERVSPCRPPSSSSLRHRHHHHHPLTFSPFIYSSLRVLVFKERDDALLPSIVHDGLAATTFARHIYHHNSRSNLFLDNDNSYSAPYC